MKNIFITATGTDAGKTVISRAIIRALHNRGIQVSVNKPVESGVPYINCKPAPHDATALKKAAKSEVSINEICPYMFRDPISPHLAAANENRTIDKDEILDFITRNDDNADIKIIEGAGGFLTPLTNSLLYGDLIKESGIPIIIVAPDILGTINATLLTIEAARKRDIEILGVILNNCAQNNFGNKEAIAAFGGVTILGSFPNVNQDSTDDELAKIAERTINIGDILSNN
jgi:dethiobiotin synthetase